MSARQRRRRCRWAPTANLCASGMRVRDRWCAEGTVHFSGGTSLSKASVPRSLISSTKRVPNGVSEIGSAAGTVG